jgi:hypothetical protein
MLKILVYRNIYRTELTKNEEEIKYLTNVLVLRIKCLEYTQSFVDSITVNGTYTVRGGPTLWEQCPIIPRVRTRKKLIPFPTSLLGGLSPTFLSIIAELFQTLSEISLNIP